MKNYLRLAQFFGKKSSLRGRRLKGKGKGFWARGKREGDSPSLPFQTSATQAKTKVIAWMSLASTLPPAKRLGASLQLVVKATSCSRRPPPYLKQSAATGKSLKNYRMNLAV